MSQLCKIGISNSKLAERPKSIFRIRRLLIPGIQSPRKFVAQGLQEIIFVEPHQAEVEFLPAHGQLYILFHYFLAGVKGTNEMVGPPLYFKGNDIIIRHYNRPDVEIMRCYRSYYKTGRFRKYHRPVAT